MDRISCFSRDGRAKGIEVDGGRRDCCIFFFRSLFRPIVSFLDPPPHLLSSPLLLSLQLLKRKLCWRWKESFVSLLPPIVASLKSFPFPFSADGKTCKRDASLSQDAHIHSCVTLILVRPLKAPGGGIRGLPRSSCHFCHLAFTNFLPPRLRLHGRVLKRPGDDWRKDWGERENLE